MRLSILDRGHSFGTKLLFMLIRAMSRHPLPEALKLVMYRADFYGTPMQKVTQAAMRGPSAWSVGDRELMAAFISTINGCSREQVEDALAVYYAFSTMNRLADAFDFAIGTPEEFVAGAQYLLARIGISIRFMRRLYNAGVSDFRSV